MSLSLRHALAALVMSASVLFATGSTAHAATATEVDGEISVPCWIHTYKPDADWYFPATTSPKALVYLQHGFSRANDNVADLARKYQAAGYLVFAPTLPSADIYGCTVNNLGNNTVFLNSVAAWIGTATTSSGALATSYAAAAAKAGRSGSTLPTGYVLAGHSAGGEAVAYIADRLRTTYPAAFANLKHLQLLDPVKSIFGNNLANGLNGLAGTSLPILTISSPPYLANSDAGGTVALTDLIDRDFLGVRLTTGSHCDAEGASTNALCTLTAGTSQAANVTALQTLAVNWAIGTDPSYYPGGTYSQGLLSGGVIQTLSGN
ncbi:alpha/beta hydrolase [Actinoplanes sichuanensis]|uniref:Alpha/beta hydrolase n=1 Tax=Actinoplanes sichuanensis TaxID=512349 RepID=A0ABW4A667_9ACTN|nr:alpha/beta hydrolase [Actinoplanes sichuanensis]